MSKKSMLWLALLCSLVIALAGLTGCGGDREPVYVTPPEPEVVEELPTGPVFWPLTGVEADNHEVILGRTLSVKVDNHPQSGSKVGINSADVVFETLAEGGITRFNAIYQSEIPEIVMPVRSARDSDTYIVPQFGDALFFYSGGNRNVLRKLRNADIASLDHGAVGDALYSRSPERAAPHNLMVNLANAYDVASGKDFEVKTTEPIVGFAFRDADSNSADVGEAATQAHIFFSPVSDTRWTWDGDSGLWLRTVSGQAQYDGATDDQIGFNNVIVMWATHSIGSMAGNVATYDIDLASGGDVTIFMDGRRVDGVWEGSEDAPQTFKDSDGNPILLSPGRTWVSVMRVGDGISSYNDSDNNADSDGY